MNCAPTSFYPQHICLHDRRIEKAHSSSDLCITLIAICFTCFTCFTCIGRSGIRISSGIILKQEGKTLRYGETGPHATPDSCASTQGSACCYLRESKARETGTKNGCLQRLSDNESERPLCCGSLCLSLFAHLLKGEYAMKDDNTFPDNGPCPIDIENAFLENPTEKPDASCISSVQEPTFT